MADYSFVDVTGLAQVPGGVQDGDVLLLVRGNEDGTKTCYSVSGGAFKGADGKTAYDVAREQGFEGTLEEWEAQVRCVSELRVTFDGDGGEIVIAS